jgi:aminoglycoside 6'-N-acetyltransferase
MLVSAERLSIRMVTADDADVLHKWLTDARVLEFYEGRDRPYTLEMVQEKFFAPDDDTQKCIAEYDGTPIGYIQFYPIEEDERVEFGYADREVVYGMDQFIGEPAFWNQGIGTQLVTLLAEYLFARLGATVVVMDPQVRNVRALRCYEKCGFQQVRLLPRRELHEGVLQDCWLIEKKR